MDLDTFTRAYIECALWASMDNSDPNTGGNPMDQNYSVQDIAPETLAQMVKDCAEFQESNATLLGQWYSECGESPERAGHDYWLTRNRHGAGYWDRWDGGTPQGKIGRALTELAHLDGGCYLYTGDDGKVYAQ